LAVLASFGALVYAAPGWATTYNVTTSAQLLTAVAAANANPGPDIINLAPGFYSVSDLTVTDDLTLNGGGRPGTVLDGTGSFGHAGVDVGGGTSLNLHVNVNNLTIQNFNDGVYSSNGPTGLVTINGCTITGSTVFGVGVDAGPVQILNSTISGNFYGVNVGNEGDPGNVIVLDDDTIVGNTVYGLSMFLVAVAVSNTIIANNNTGGGFHDCNASVVTGGGGGYACSSDHNIDSDGSGGPGFTTVAPMLGPLADNGGPTETYALLSGSSAIDNGGSTCLSTDQRGVTRPQGLACDIGAFEHTPFPFVSVRANLTPGGSITTGSGTTPTNPLQTGVTAPGGGIITIEQGPGADFGFLGQNVQITAVPDATSSNPFVIVFTIDASVIPSGESAATIVVTKNGVVVPPCTGAPGTAAPDPCVESRVVTAGGGAQLTVLSSTASKWGFTTQSFLAVEDRPTHLEFAVFPNPIRRDATVLFALPTASDVDLSVFDLAGRRVATLVAGVLAAGRHSMAWHEAEQLSSGLYFIRLRVGTEVRTSTVLRVK
jgi:hypothetical protein